MSLRRSSNSGASGARIYCRLTNCSICRRNGALWAFYANNEIRLQGHPENTIAYVWGQCTIRTMHCKYCGCVTHWENIDAAVASRVGVNTRNFDPATMLGVKVRRFDGAETWTYID